MKKTTPIKDDDWTTKEYIALATGSVLLLGGGFLLARHVVRKTKENKEQNQSFEDGTSATNAKGLKMAFENDGWPGTNLPEVRRIIRELPSKEEFQKVSKSYNRLYQSNLLKEMSDELQSSEYSEMINILASKPETGKSGLPVYNFRAWAKRLKAAFEKSYGFMPGTDEDAIMAVFTEIPTQRAFKEVANAYRQEYSASLIDDLKSELEAWEYGDYMKIITKKPLQ